MSIRSKQAIAGVLALAAAYVGFWAQVAPHSFYKSFPLTGHHWLPPLGPYNEHLIRDVGGLYLALLVISVLAVARPRPETLRMVGAGWLAFSIPHFVFHMVHLDMYDTADESGNIVSLVGTIVLAGLLLLPTARGPHAPPPPPTEHEGLSSEPMKTAGAPGSGPLNSSQASERP